MHSANTFKKFFKIAVITSPLFGLFGAMPRLTSHEFEIGRVITFFLFITGFTLYLWLINIFLLKGFNKINSQQTNTIRYVLSVLICISTVYLIFLSIPHIPPKRLMETGPPGGMPLHFSPARMFFFPMVQGLSIDIIIVVLMELIILKETKLKVDSENEHLKLANLEARNSQLQQQLNPHFLFNSLSTLRSLINRSPEKAEEYLERLSELLRFSTNNSQQSLILLKEEVDLCTNYLDMQKTRFGNALSYTIDIPQGLQAVGKVPVFSLQQLAENAIKHNVLTKEQPLFITIEIDEKGEWISIKNNLQPKQIIEYSGGIGLANLSERYRLAGNNDIAVKSEKDTFCVSIKILYDEGNHN